MKHRFYKKMSLLHGRKDPLEEFTPVVEETTIIYQPEHPSLAMMHSESKIDHLELGYSEVDPFGHSEVDCN